MREATVEAPLSRRELAEVKRRGREIHLRRLYEAAESLRLAQLAVEELLTGKKRSPA